MQVKSKPALHASWIDDRAKDVVKRLQSRGFKAYLVGGCVRDLLVGIHPKDFDIATSALPNEVKKNIPGSYVIGRRFRLVLVKRGLDQFEVATFRRASRPEDFTELIDEDAPAPSGDNFFGTPEEDALRRDFTINAMFYDPVSEELIDFAGAMNDIKSQTLRMIGDPAERIKEDPIRSLRAIRFAHKLGFRIEASLREAITKHTAEVGAAILPRRREEFLKLLRLKEPSRAFFELWDLGLIHTCFPTLVAIFEDSERLEIFMHYLDRMDDLVWNKDQTVELYVPLVLAFAQASKGLADFEQRRDRFFRDEIGLFKSEATEILYAFETKDKLHSIESFKKRGSRRQAAFLSQPSLPLAFRVATFERELAPGEFWFWHDKLNADH
ncbi:MAG: CCA tRNA nucleotidyltransferase [Bdellovibrio sp.]|jgi:poly(A) polymerase